MKKSIGELLTREGREIQRRVARNGGHRHHFLSKLNTQGAMSFAEWSARRFESLKKPEQGEESVPDASLHD